MNVHPDRYRALIALLMGGCLVLGLAGCAGSTGARAGSAPASDPAGAPTSATSPPTATLPTPTDSPGASGPFLTITPTESPFRPAPGTHLSLQGQVVAGAGPGCLILQTSQGQFELLSTKGQLHVGEAVSVTGQVVHVMSHCMQGTTFQVDQISTADH